MMQRSEAPVIRLVDVCPVHGEVTEDRGLSRASGRLSRFLVNQVDVGRLPLDLG